MISFLILNKYLLSYPILYLELETLLPFHPFLSFGPCKAWILFYFFDRALTLFLWANPVTPSPKRSFSLVWSELLFRTTWRAVTDTIILKEISGRVEPRGKEKRTRVVGGQRQVSVVGWCSGREHGHIGSPNGAPKGATGTQKSQDKETPLVPSPTKKKARKETEMGCRI